MLPTFALMTIYIFVDLGTFLPVITLSRMNEDGSFSGYFIK